jgi:hypothetical protein
VIFFVIIGIYLWSLSALFNLLNHPYTVVIMNILIFGDQTADQYPLLRKACTWKNNAALTTFLDRISVVIRDEVQKLPRTQRDQIPDFLTTWDLVEAYYSKGIKVPQMDSCMVTIAQLAHYIGYVDWSEFLHPLTHELDTMPKTHPNFQTSQTHASLVFVLVCLRRPSSHLRDR